MEPHGLPFRPEEACSLHLSSCRFIEGVLARPHDGPTVVVSHHAPHPGSVAQRYRGDPLTPAFVSDLSDLMARGRPDLWVHGHTHTSFDYRVGPTRVVCNPRGFPGENDVFDPGLVVEVGS